MDPNPALQQALNHLQSGQPDRCVQACNAILDEIPGLIQAMYLRGCASYENGDTERSVSDLQVVHANHPEHLGAAFYLGRSLRAAGRFEEALAPLRSAAADNDLEVRARYELATCLTRLRRRPEAIEHYRAILALDPGHAQVMANLASLLERENRLEEAGHWAGEALRADPGNETARMACAVLDQRHGRYANASRRLRGLIPDIGNPVNRSIAWNRLGQALEGQEKWDAAFDAFTESNRVLRAHHPRARPAPRGPHGLETLARIRAWLEEEPLAEWTAPVTEDAGGLAFLVGFPRSGTTLLNRMLAAHPEVEVLEEKSLFSSLHQDWSAPGTLEALAGVSAAQIQDARATYRREMASHQRAPERSLVIDKLPLNLAYLFLIHRLFPAAPVIFLQRHPLDTCLSCYCQAFELEASMGYFLDLGRTAEYYDAVMQVAALSLAQIGNPVHRLRYEDLVGKPESELRALIDFLGLEWSADVLDDRQRAGGDASNTPSYQHASQPLYTASIGRWRHYEQQLESMRPVLQRWVQKLDYAASAAFHSSKSRA